MSGGPPDGMSPAPVAPPIPSVRIGQVDVPRLILGDHGFLRKYGSSLTDAQVRQNMRYAQDRADLGLTGGDLRCLRLATTVAGATGFVLYHTDVRFVSSGRRAHFGRCMSTLHAHLGQVAPAFLRKDPLTGAFVASNAGYRPYRSTDRLTLDPAWWTAEQDRLTRYRPHAVSVGGDYLDALLALDRFEVALDALRAYAKICRRWGSILVLTSYLLGVLDLRRVGPLLACCDAVMAPVNALGHGMVPDPERALRKLRNLHLPVVGMHTLASGCLPPATALPHAFASAGLAAAVVGASTREHIDELIHGGRGAVDGARHPRS
ncbi:hypothetical protein AB0F68_06935 [Micromonospora sp. NPDC023966]|uniref:hypothetical protein n=1 Tax=Micromonospora sp. NPDC023966 TaxID=3154699 RepID=UPI0033D34CD5